MNSDKLLQYIYLEVYRKNLGSNRYAFSIIFPCIRVRTAETEQVNIYLRLAVPVFACVKRDIIPQRKFRRK